MRPESGEHLRRAAIAKALAAETCLHVANAGAGGVSLVAVEADASGKRIVRAYAGTGADMPDDLCGASLLSREQSFLKLGPSRLRKRQIVSRLTPTPATASRSVRCGVSPGSL